MDKLKAEEGIVSKVVFKKEMILFISSRALTEVMNREHMLIMLASN
ncbi:MAG: hypothetical protein LBJ95_02625 [Oscillospiraceae bacterium]|jgi:hypothetical protein|nr:hypothetical protein [Oscillospiraceae bacterium]